MATLPPPTPGQPRVQVDVGVMVRDMVALRRYVEEAAGKEPLEKALLEDPQLLVEQAYARACPADPEEGGFRDVFVSARPHEGACYNVQLVADVSDEEVLRQLARERGLPAAPSPTTGRTAFTLDETVIQALVTPQPSTLDGVLRQYLIRGQVLPGQAAELHLQRFGSDEAPDPEALIPRLRRGERHRGHPRIPADVLAAYTFEPVLVSHRSLRKNQPYYSWATAAFEPSAARWRLFRWRRDGRVTDCLPSTALVPPRRLQLEVPWFEEQYAREHPQALLLANAVRGGSGRLSYLVEVGRYESNDRLALRVTDGTGVPSIVSRNVPCARLLENQAIVAWPAMPVLAAAGAARDTFQRISVGPETFPIVEVVNPGPPTFRALSGEKADVAELVASLGITHRGLER